MDTRTLTDKIAKALGRSRDDTGRMLESLKEIIADDCSAMDTVAIPGFGAFEPRKRLERVGVHPATGKRILIPPKIVLGFKPSALLKQKIRNER